MQPKIIRMTQRHDGSSWRVDGEPPRGISWESTPSTQITRRLVGYCCEESHWLGEKSFIVR